MNAIQHKDELLQQIAAGVNKYQDVKSSCLKVTLVTHDAEYEWFGLAPVLDVLANDIYWDERGDWSEARIARVEPY
jgi:hypothetical protein